MKTKHLLLHVSLLLTINSILPTFSFSQRIAGQWRSSVFVCPDNTVRSCGYNVDGNLGDSTNVPKDMPVQVWGPGGVGYLTGITDVAAGWGHTLAIKNDRTVWSWGRNDKGQLGNNSIPVPFSNQWTPIPVLGPGGTGFLTGITAVAGGSLHSLALKDDGTVWAWGDNQYGQLGDGTNTQRSTPVQVSGLTGIFTAIAAGSQGGFSLALRSDSTVWAWGRNTYGQLGNNTTTNSAVPVQVKGPGGTGFLTGVVAIAKGFHHSLAVKNDGTVWAWGSNNKGELGDNTLTQRNTPVQVTGLTGIVKDAAAGDWYSLARKNDGTVWAWGGGGRGQLGNNTNSDSPVPVQVLGPGGTGFLTGVTAIAAGSEHSFAVKSDGSIWVWGFNFYKQLGTGSGINELTPVQPLSLCVAELSANINGTNPPCYGECTGKANAVISGGQAPYTFQWNTSPVQTTPTATGLCAGTVYTVTATDAMNTTAVTATVTLTNPPPLTITANSTGPNCPCAESVTSNLLGGIPSYTFLWQPSNQTTITATGLCAGTHTITITDGNGCVNSTTITLTQPPAPADPVPPTVASNPSCGNTYLNTMTPPGGETYFWQGKSCVLNGVSTTSSIYPVTSSGIYYVRSRNNAGCWSLGCGSVTVTVNAFPAVNPVPTNASCATCPDGMASANATGGASPYTYSWIPSGGTAPTATGLLPGSYTVCVTDANGCSKCSAVAVGYSTGINDPQSSDAISIYPNPFAESATLRIIPQGMAYATNLNELRISDIKIVDVVGREVHPVIIRNSDSFVIRSRNIPDGIYFIQIKSENGTTVQKLIIQK